jgi:hypothetical protein
MFCYSFSVPLGVRWCVCVVSDMHLWWSLSSQSCSFCSNSNWCRHFVLVSLQADVWDTICSSRRRGLRNVSETLWLPGAMHDRELGGQPPPCLHPVLGCGWCGWRQLSGTKSPSRSPTPWLCGQTVSTCTDGAGKGSEGVLTLGLIFFSKTSVCDPLPIMKTLSSVTISADYYDSPFRISHNTPCTISNFDLLSNKIIIWHICPLYSFLLALPLSKWSASPTSTARSSCS